MLKKLIKRFTALVHSRADAGMETGLPRPAAVPEPPASVAVAPAPAVEVIEGDGGDAQWALWEQALRKSRGEPAEAPHVLDGDPQWLIVQQSFERIANRLKLVWGCPEFRPYMDGLLHDTRGGARKGFPAAVLFALHGLSEAHDDAFPAFRSKVDRWSGHMDDLQRAPSSRR